MNIFEQTVSAQSRASVIIDQGKTLRKTILKEKALNRKRKTVSEESDQPESLGKAYLSKEEKKMKQKLKNRESAQKSRDMKKQYISELEAKNRLLQAQIDQLKKEKELLSNQRMCSRCHTALSQTTYQTSFELDSDKFQHSPFLSSNSPAQQNYFRIVQQPNNSNLQLFLLICFIVVGALIGNPLAPEAKPNLLVDVNHLSTSLVPYNATQDSCLKQYLQMKSFETIEGNLRRSTQQHPDQNDILVCRSPFLFKYNSSRELVSEHMEILVRGQQLNITNTGSQQTPSPLNGRDLYMLLVEVKGISKYSGMKCLA